MRWLALLFGITISGGVFQPVQMGEPAAGGGAVTSSFTMSRSSGTSPAIVRVNAEGSTTSISGRDTDRHCKHEWDFGDSWASGTDGWDYGTADSSKTKNWMGHSPYAAHVYEEPVANWSVSDDSGTAMTITHTITCWEDDGTKHTDSSNQTFTVNDPLSVADADDNDVDAENAVCIRDSNAPTWTAPCDNGTVITDRVTMAAADLGAELGTQTQPQVFLQDPGATAFTITATRNIAANRYVHVIGGDGEAPLSESFSGTDIFFTMSDFSMIQGLMLTTTDSANSHKGYAINTDAEHVLIYKGGTSGVGTSLSIDSASDNDTLAIWGGDFDMDGVTAASSGNATFFLEAEVGGTVLVNNWIDRETEHEFALRAACTTLGSVLAHNEIRDSGGPPAPKNHVAIRDSCNGAVGNNDSTFAWNAVSQTGDLNNSFMMQFNPQNTTSTDERQQGWIVEGNIGHIEYTCGNDAQPSNFIRTSARHSTYRHNVFVDDLSSCADSDTTRVYRQQNLQDSPLAPDYDPPSGSDTEQLGDNDFFHSITVGEGHRNASLAVISDCKTSGGDSDDTCGSEANNLVVSDNGRTLSVGDGATSTTDPDTYFGTYADAAATGTYTVNDFKRASTSADGSCTAKHMWHADGTEYTWGSCSNGLYD